MFDSQFFPTPENVIAEMLTGQNINNKVILEPSAGSGNIIDYCKMQGAKDVLFCEKHIELQKIAATKGRFLCADFFDVKSEDVSHIDFIIMNPPFSNAAEHILKAFEIAPKGCKIIALCNNETVENTYSESRKRLAFLIAENGSFKNLGNCFEEAERKTNVDICCITLTVAGEAYSEEFEGFFTDDEPTETGEIGLMSYNVVRDLVNRYVAAIKLFDKQIELGIQMNNLTRGFYCSSISFECTEDKKPKTRNDFKKDLQKSGWQFIFNKMDLKKYTTKGLKEDINKFVEQQEEIPFTMKNIYKMIEIVIGTTGSRMDKAILEVFDKLTTHYHDNRFNVEGWKTNSHFLINRTFILPYIVDTGVWSCNKDTVKLSSYSHSENIEDMVKAICFLTGDNYDLMPSLNSFVTDTKMLYGKWYDWGFFEIKGYKKGTMHFKFKTEGLWAKFNQKVGQLKGFPLYEHKAPQPKESYTRREERKQPQHRKEFKTIFSTTIN
jgi:hypothetical protein